MEADLLLETADAIDHLVPSAAAIAPIEKQVPLDQIRRARIVDAMRTRATPSPRKDKGNPSGPATR